MIGGGTTATSFGLAPRSVVGWNGRARHFKPVTALRDDELHQLLLATPAIVDSDLLWLGQQIATGSGRRLDLLAINRSGNLLAVEARQSCRAADALADIIAHGAWCRRQELKDLTEIYEEAVGGQLAVDFYNRFGAPLCLSGRIALCVVAPDVGRIRSTLSVLEAAGIEVAGIACQCFEHDVERIYTFESIN